MNTPKLNSLIDVEGIASQDGFVTLPVEAIELIETSLPNPKKEVALESVERKNDSELTDLAQALLDEEFKDSHSIKDGMVSINVISFNELIVEVKEAIFTELFQGNSITISSGNISLSIQQVNQLAELLK